MNKLRTNPFSFGNPVQGEYYLQRPELRSTVVGFIENRINVVLIGPRRFGKTSFVLDLLQSLEKNHVCIFADIFNITSHRDFLQQMLRAIKTKSTLGQRFKEWAEGMTRLKPRLGWDTAADGQMSFSLSVDVTSDHDIKETIQDVLSGLKSLGRNVVVAIDEFQKIAELEEQGWLEATLRSQMQQLTNTAFVLTGSRQGIIRDMLNNQSRPFYRSAQPIEFPVFGEEFTNWIIQRFSGVGVNCNRAAIEKLRADVQNTPNYVQMACFHLVAQGVTNVTTSEVESVLKTMVRQNSYAYQTLLNSMTLMQQRVLRLAAKEGEQIYAKGMLKKYEITSGPALASALKTLKNKQILDESSTKGRVVFDDPLFAIWLRTEFS